MKAVEVQLMRKRRGMHVIDSAMTSEVAERVLDYMVETTMRALVSRYAIMDSVRLMLYMGELDDRIPND